MFDRLENIEGNFNKLTEKISDPNTIANQEIWIKLIKEHSSLTDIVEKYREYKTTQEEINDLKSMLGENVEDDFKQLIKNDLKDNEALAETKLEELKLLLVPKDPNDEKNVIVEIRGGAGGSEADLFAGDLYRMYTRYAERNRWKIEILNSNENEIGGFKEISFLINGRGAYSRLKYESGVHRVQRIPITESGGRIHTSTVTVAVLPEAEEVDVELNMNDIRIDVFRSSGNGGQSVNTTDSAVRITHEPTGLVVSCQDEKSQHKNRDKALKVLRAKLYELEIEKQHSEISAERKSQVGTGGRSERIRTYNFPQSRVSDHRINITLHKLDQVLDGELDEFMDILITTEQVKKMETIKS